MVPMHEAGFAGTTLSFVNVKDELPSLAGSVPPLLREAALRER
jgi:dimethylsulfone monooxygenase